MWTVIGRSFIFCLSLFLFLSPLKALAEDTAFEATVSANKVSMQDMVELTLTVKGSKDAVSTIPLPAIEGFDARYVGPATKFTMINGVTSNEKSFVYDLFPSKTGHFQIPAIEVTLDGKVYQSSPIDIEVVDKPAETPSSDDQGPVAEESINDKVFMKAFVGAPQVYVGQKTPLLMKVYVRGQSLQLASVPSLTPDGFTADPTANMQRTKEVLNGVNYDLLRFDTNIYPTRAGTVSIGPFVAQGDLLYKTRQTNDLFGDLFASTTSRPIVLHAPALSLTVLPLPTEGKPQDFTGAVGQYDFKVSVGPESVKVGDPLTLRMTITGQGHLKELTPPVFNDTRFKTYDPQIKDAENTKTVEQVIIPTDSKITEVPALSFSYFDPQEKKYKTITQGPFLVKVLAPVAGEEFKAFGFVDKTKSGPDKSYVVKFDGVKGLAQKALDQGMTLLRNVWFWLCMIIGGIVWLALYAWGEFQNRLKKDEGFAREWKADAKAKELLKNTKSYLQQNNSKEFYKSLYKTLNDYLADKMHVPLASLSWPTIESYLQKRSVDPAKLQTIKELFERCDLVRFASASIDESQMARDFEQLQNLISYLPKILK